ncbi:hypothetical protein PCO31010_05084 [Pandoraea commovens]|uniref:Uncharacterized protein n=1 Tax=Pandoraea commovens TaxID=2508289 RepID=A0A5E4Z6U2_9BURK|nr:hypothetical protein PCO31010_05084 [Pandoraea commovens]
MYRARCNEKTCISIHPSSKKPNIQTVLANEKAVPIFTGTALFHLLVTC